jgi:hypothetical protein
MAFFILGATTMHVSPYEPETPARKGGGQAEPQHGADAHAEMRASPARGDEEQAGDEPVDEPGYGHGV